MKTLLAWTACFLVSGPAAAAEPLDYLRDVKPILAQNCVACHGARVQRSGLRLDTAAAALKGGNAGPALVPGKSAESRLIQAVTGSRKDVAAMPPEKPRLPDKQIALLRAWIDQGAKAPADEVADSAAAGKSSHWAFQPVVRPAVPQVRSPKSEVRNSIDAFVLDRLRKQSILPSPEADRVTLIRRLSLDLLGLPPAPPEVDAFVKDPSPDAYERLVERLLASPHYGERWGRHWLDLARYADSNGYSIDGARSIWKYREWVLDAFNRDLPFDRFTVEQIAGDLLPGATPEQKTATGFHRNTMINQEGGIDLEQFRVEAVVDRVNTTGSVFLGLTVGCCQCHDHKFDPLSQREYYQLFAFLNNQDEPTLELATPEQAKQRARVRAQIADLEKRLKALDTTSAAKQEQWEKNLTTGERTKLPKEIRVILDVPENGRNARQKQALTAFYRKTDLIYHAVAGLGDPLVYLGAAHLQAGAARTMGEKQIAELKKKDPEIVTTLVLQERKAPRTTHIMLGGDFTRKGVQVAAATPAVLHALPDHRPGSAGLNRLDLARWLVDPANPLTPRVTVNRFWQHYFGAGLVETENDFGTQGTPPTHPELLDWLAAEFVERGWSMKAMHRLIVTSATYRQSSRARPDLATVDPRNKLLARQVRLRLDAEFVRDAALEASGMLTPKVGGPSVFPPQPDGVYRFTQINKDWKASTGPDRYRRGLYTYLWRSAPHPGLTVFDAPDATTTCTRRNRSNTPLQALTLLNDQAYFEFAQGLAVRVLNEANPNDEERLRYAFRLCLARTPSELELKRLSQLLARQRAEFDAAPEEAKLLAPAELPEGTDAGQVAAWVTVARVLLNLDEFITRE